MRAGIAECGQIPTVGAGKLRYEVVDCALWSAVKAPNQIVGNRGDLIIFSHEGPLCTLTSSTPVMVNAWLSWPEEGGIFVSGGEDPAGGQPTISRHSSRADEELR